jgi:hypothetical protein
MPIAGLALTPDEVPPRHDIEVAGVTILILSADNGAPLRISVIGAKVGDHHDDALASSSSSSAGRAS